ncbi:AMP-dependent synthetase and ligase [Oscillochloris trichoides DG-6]|uniref:Acetate--CoA ligase n=1 Tax=Oscillochloris trichoides DG-6 TaxID=765420 RepID=E1IE03_9CHLR|nr:acetate--CoA ligase [Oscillochloris trichoides]EFO80614.1 AMP-dependent synthetase and ligase [Oscillochloris trichoides DG-6]
MGYDDTHRRSIEDPAGYWGELAEELHWYKRWDKVLDDSQAPFYRWFVGAETNLCYNAVDRHALGARRGQAALIWESAETGQSRTLTYFELYREVNRLAGVLKNLGVQKGDRIIIYMPMVPEAIIGMLACARLGAIHSVVFGGFSITSLASRIDDAEPVLIMTADASTRKGIPVPLKEIIDHALEAAEGDSVRDVLVLNRGLVACEMKKGRDLDWEEQLEKRGEKYVEPVRVASTDPSYILYTSGTTGKPKGVVRDTGGYMVALHASMSQIYNCGDGDVFWSTSDIGWVVGHSYIVYGPLLKGIPTVVYEGRPDHPDPGVWWRVIEKYGVTHVFTAPTALRALRKFPDQWMKNSDISSMQILYAAGEPLDAPTYEWAKDTLGVPVIDHYWQTESGWSMLTNPVGVELLPIKAGSPTKAAFGHFLEVVDSDGNPVPRGEKGFLVDHGPLPPGMLMTLWNDDDRYVKSYWNHFKEKLLYMTGDYAIQDEDGYFWMLGRADEVLNVSGHRLGTREIEEVVASHQAVAENCVIGVRHELKGEGVLVVAVLKQHIAPADQDGVARELRTLVRERIGPIASPDAIHFVNMLPKTRSGKIMRRVIRAVYQGDNIGDLSTIEDDATVDMVREAVDVLKGEL